MQWRMGRLEEREREWICEHGIGHWKWPHGCDGCCDRDDYPNHRHRDKEKHTYL